MNPFKVDDAARRLASRSVGAGRGAEEARRGTTTDGRAAADGRRGRQAGRRAVVSQLPRFAAGAFFAEMRYTWLVICRRQTDKDERPCRGGVWPDRPPSGSNCVSEKIIST